VSTIEKTIDVDVPVRTAYNQWTQFEEFPRFMEGVERVEQRSDTMMHWVTRVGGVSREFDAQIVDQRPDQCVHWRSVDGPRQEGEVTFEPLDAGHTRVLLHMDFDPQGIVEKTGDVLGIVGRRAEGDLQRFKEFVEHRGVETGAWRGDIEQGRVEEPGGMTGGTTGGTTGAAGMAGTGTAPQGGTSPVQPGAVPTGGEYPSAEDLGTGRKNPLDAPTPRPDEEPPGPPPAR
jgi:ribosome-associated toxin RatA of RatAB toxin-antitoxin module